MPCWILRWRLAVADALAGLREAMVWLLVGHGPATVPAGKSKPRRAGVAYALSRVPRRERSNAVRSTLAQRALILALQRAVTPATGSRRQAPATCSPHRRNSPAPARANRCPRS